MKFVVSVAGVGLVLLVAPTVEAQSISKQGFNFNPPPCPGRSTGATISTNKFSDGTPLPSCGGREQNGTTIKTYELVWTGHVWAEYPPSAKVVSTVPLAAPGAGNLPRSPGTPSLTPSIVSTLPQGIMNGTSVYLYQNNWVSLVASGGGNYTTTLVASGAGNLVASGGGNLVASGGGNLVGPSGGTYSLQSVGSGGTVRTSAGHNIVLNAANLAKYKRATGTR